MEEITYYQSGKKLLVTLVIDFFLASLLIGFFLFPYHLIQYLRTTLTLGTHALALKTGLITTNITEIPYSHVNSVSVKKGIFGNILGYGDVVILTGNDVKGEVIPGIQNPDELRQEILKRTQRSSSGSPVKHEGSKYSELEQLASLKDKGIITPEEFEQKKKQILETS